jgi:hypothetical protein
MSSTWRPAPQRLMKTGSIGEDLLDHTPRQLFSRENAGLRRDAIGSAVSLRKKDTGRASGTCQRLSLPEGKATTRTNGGVSDANRDRPAVRTNSGREFHPLKSSAFHGALFRQLRIAALGGPLQRALLFASPESLKFITCLTRLRPKERDKYLFSECLLECDTLEIFKKSDLN